MTLIYLLKFEIYLEFNLLKNLLVMLKESPMKLLLKLRSYQGKFLRLEKDLK